MIGPSAAAGWTPPFPFRFSGYAGMDIGRDNGMPVDRSYADRSPFPFTGTVKRVVFDIQPHSDIAAEQALHEHAQRSLAAHGMSG
jgi:arylsulfatase